MHWAALTLPLLLVAACGSSTATGDGPDAGATEVTNDANEPVDLAPTGDDGALDAGTSPGDLADSTNPTDGTNGRDLREDATEPSDSGDGPGPADVADVTDLDTFEDAADAADRDEPVDPPDGSDVYDAADATDSHEVGTDLIDAADVVSDAVEVGAEMDGGPVLDAADLGESCPQPEYAAYFEANEAVAAATIDGLTEEGLLLFCQGLSELEVTGEVETDEPVASVECEEPTSCLYLTFEPHEVTAIHAAKLAHAVWLDHNELVPWRLSDFTSAELEGLFAQQVLFRNGNGAMSVVDYSPSAAYAYMVSHELIGETAWDTLFEVIDDVRSTDAAMDFIHGIEGRGDPIRTSYTLHDALETTVDTAGGPVRISRFGCHSASRILLGLLRSVNIPGLEVHNGQWYGTGHSTAAWPVFDTAMAHGDHLYSALLRGAPTEALLADPAFYTAPEHIAVCGTDSRCLGLRQEVLVGLEYPSSYTLGRCCGAETKDACQEGLASDYGPFLTGDEVAAGAESLWAMCD